MGEGMKDTLILVGDIHGRYEEFLALCKLYKHAKAIIQLGDFGLGFGGATAKNRPLPPNVFFIRGNHDDPALCREHPNYLGDFGVIELGGVKIGFVGGGWSIDYKWRTPGVSWWSDEELSREQLDEAHDLIVNSDVSIMLSHECPASIVGKLKNVNGKPIKTRTSDALERIADRIPQARWYFGHYHELTKVWSAGIEYQCIPELCSESCTLTTENAALKQELETLKKERSK